MAGLSVQVILSTGKTMFSRSPYLILRRAQCNIIAKSMKYSTTVTESTDKDPAPFFFNDEVQNILKTLTRADNKKLFKRRKDGSKITDPEYKFMTDEELKKALAEAQDRGLRRLQMPPVVKERTEIDSVLSKDPELQGYDTARLMCVDISFIPNDHERLIVVREPDGTLRHAKWEERKRLTQIYFPMQGREMNTPRMFQQEHLMNLISRQEYEFILDRACIQFDPNDPEYHRVTATVYDAVNEEKLFEKLLSTRHYGPLVFHLVWKKNLDNLLLHYITKENIEDAVLAVKLYNAVHPDGQSSQLQHEEGNEMQFLRDFVATESSIKRKLAMALNSLQELLDTRANVAKAIKEAHGL